MKLVLTRRDVMLITAWCGCEFNSNKVDMQMNFMQLKTTTPKILIINAEHVVNEIL